MIRFTNSLLILAGFTDAVLGTVSINENVLLGIIMLLSGILTVIIGCLTAAFLSHISAHKKNTDNEKLEELILDLIKELKKNA
jgi:hypothetical protein